MITYLQGIGGEVLNLVGTGLKFMLEKIGAFIVSIGSFLKVFKNLWKTHPLKVSWEYFQRMELSLLVSLHLTLTCTKIIVWDRN